MSAGEHSGRWVQMHRVYGLIESRAWILSAKYLKLLKHFVSKLKKQLNQINFEQK